MTLFTIAMIIIGMALLLAAGHYGLQFYPPGYGYDEEKRNNRRARNLVLASLLPLGLAAAQPFIF